MLESTGVPLNHWILYWLDSSKSYLLDHFYVHAEMHFTKWMHCCKCDVVKSALSSLNPIPAFKDQMFQTDKKSVFVLLARFSQDPKICLKKAESL